tara:strand:- start:102410 stop:103858 length:1449 start_codon:yes stop_codon:yes gene_type:complete
MIFNTIDFAIFLPIIFILYWFVIYKNILHQNLLITISSYVFYGWWDWRFLSLIAFSTSVDYIIGNKLSITQNKNSRKLLLFTSVFVNLGFLGFFKYYNFFLENFVDAFSFFGYSINSNSLNIILPVGISFYTFQTLSYTIDVYKKKIKPAKDIISFTAFVSFFPQLVAGPIERAKNLLPQFYKKRDFDYYKAVDGMRQILLGLFKKIVIADNCAVFADQIFNNYQDYSGSTLILGAILFTFQIYCDFSGYSDIAIGTARLFGFNLMQNFAFPYFSRDIAEFWRRWHISLSTWFRDYLYIPLGGSRGSNYQKIRNVFIIFLVSGFWHGANWTFIIWGALNAIYFLPIMLMKRNRINTDIVAKDRLFPSIKELVSIIITFSLTVFAWIFFRSESVNDGFAYLFNIIDSSVFTLPDLITPKLEMIYTLFCIIILLFFEWKNRKKTHALEIDHLTKFNRWGIYLTIILMIITFGTFNHNEFIYFQF